MKKLIVIAILFTLACQVSAKSVWVDSIDIIPEQPLETDIITFDIAGRASAWPSEVEYDEFLQDGTTLQLDLYINMGILDSISYWTYLKQIGSLNAGVYNLEVRAFDNNHCTLEDTYIIDFTVTPEPTALAFFVTGLSVIRVFSRRRK